MTNVLVCGGGSGGHLYPALAMLEAFLTHPKVQRVGFIGSQKRLDAQVFAQRDDISFFSLHARHLRGDWRQKLVALGALGLGTVEAFVTLKRFGPGLLIGTGGYSSFPALLAALQMGIPTAIFEPNAKPGLVNRLLGPYVDHVFCHHKSGLPFAHKRVTETGVPLRRGLLHAQKDRALYARWKLDPQKKTLLVLGGSLGSRSLTQTALQLAQRCTQLQVIVSLGAHQQAHFSDIKQASRGLKHFKCLPYIRRMDEALALADVALCRGGALTLAELSACGVPAVIVPWEGAAESHQLYNAKKHAQQGAGLLLREPQLNLNSALDVLRQVLTPRRLLAMKQASLTIGERHRWASTHILKEVEPYLDGEISLYRHRRRRHERVGQSILAATPPAAGVQHRIQFPNF